MTFFIDFTHYICMSMFIMYIHLTKKRKVLYIYEKYIYLYICTYLSLQRAIVVSCGLKVIINGLVPVLGPPGSPPGAPGPASTRHALRSLSLLPLSISN